jgi:hypothetical protein
LSEKEKQLEDLLGEGWWINIQNKLLKIILKVKDFRNIVEGRRRKYEN